MHDKKLVGLSYPHFRYQPQVFPKIAKNCFMKNQKVDFLQFKNRWRTTTYSFSIININFHYHSIICIMSQLIISFRSGDIDFWKKVTFCYFVAPPVDLDKSLKFCLDNFSRPTTSTHCRQNRSFPQHTFSFSISLMKRLLCQLICFRRFVDRYPQDMVRTAHSYHRTTLGVSIYAILPHLQNPKIPRSL